MALRLKTRAKTNLIVVHCSATPPDLDVGVEEIDRWHRRRGFLTIGYHLVIRRDGSVETGRSLEAVGAHARGVNQRSVGVCLIGGVTKKTPRKPRMNFAEAQQEKLADVIAELRARYPKVEVLGHRDLPNARKECPSFDVRAWMARRRADKAPHTEPTQQTPGAEAQPTASARAAKPCAGAEGA